VTAASSDQAPERLSLWRLIAGLGVIAILVAALCIAGSVYLRNIRLDRYMRSLAADPATVSLSDAAIARRILDRAHALDLPVETHDVTVKRTGGQPYIQIGKYSAETSIGRIDLRLPAASSR
jgi:hypothetical protein